MFVLFAACAPTSDTKKAAQIQPGQPEPVDLAGTVWQLSAYSDGRGGLAPALPDTQANASFGSTGFVTGSAGCNTYSTVFQSGATTLSVLGPIRTTQLVCGQLVMDQEAAYLGALARAASYRIEAGHLVLMQSGGAQVAEFTR